MAFLKGVAAARRLQLRDAIFPGAHESVFVGGQAEKGWRMVPRTLPLVMTLISDLAPKGLGTGAARVYHELWMRDFGDGFVELTDEDVHAFASGYTAAGRGVRSWRACMKALEDLGFIKVAPKGARALGYVLLIHPDLVVDSLRDAEKVDPNWANAYEQRMIEIGARS
jgi:hypothetical protein